ncbi:MAG TPA: phosphoglycerate dehydrogenase [Chthonomonadaceae bacterium]|nr:phosphoglycerate dehydrogenase [Chthonomonadaceae bacterium]
MPKVLVSDPISEAGIARLREIPGVEVDVRLGLKPEELKAIIGDYDALAVRSETKVTADILSAARKLQIIGRAGVGVDNIDVTAATQRGIVVVNSPEGNTLAAAELTIALLLALARKIPQADASLRAGKWERKKFVGTEVYGKTVGVIGLGKIGRSVAQRMRSFEAEVIAYDPFATPESARRIGVELVSLEELYRRSDFITLHVPLNSETRGMIGSEQLARMKDGVRIINCARGGIIDEQALAEAIHSGKVAGAALDVFGKEPPEPSNPLLCMPENVVTPHLGASTEEAQVNVAIDIAEQIADVLQGKPARSAVNLPALSPDEMARVAPYLVLARQIGSLHTQLARENTGAGRPIDAVEVVFSGDFTGLPTETITRAVLQGLMTPILSDPVNLVNAPVLAEARGIKVTESHSRTSPEHTCLLSVRAHLPGGERTICGTVYGQDARIVHIDGYHVDIPPRGHMIVTQHTDRPGIIGKVGTLLGDNGINIAGMHVGRQSIGGRAIMVLLVDEPIPTEQMQQIRAISGMETAQLVTL